MKFLNKIPDSIFIVLLVLILLPLYIKTLLPSYDFHDVAELQAVAYTLGIAHPTGYPTYIILGKLFTFLPFGSIAWRVNFMSAFFSILSLVLVFLILKKINISKIPAFISALILGLSNNFWYFSLVAEMYSLNVFFIALLIYLYLIAPENSYKSKKVSLEKFYFWYFFALGIAQGNHRTITAFTPILVIFLFMKNTNFFSHLKNLIVITISFLLGLSIYLYIPLRALQNPYLNYAQPTNWKNFWYLVSAQQFRYMYFAIPLKTLFSELIPWFYNLLLAQFYFIGLILATLGIIYLIYKKRVKILMQLILIFFVNTIVCLMYATGELHRYFMPSFFCVGILIGCGIGMVFEIVNLIKYRFLKPLIYYLLIAIFIYYPYFLLINNYHKVDQSKNYSAVNYIRETYRNVDQNGVILSWWYYSTPLWYSQLVEEQRKDVMIYNELPGYWEVEAIKQLKLGRPVYAVTEFNLTNQNLSLIKEGNLFQVIQKSIY